MTCTCCHRPRVASNVRPYVEAYIYQLYAECSCGSTFAVTIWEAPEEDDVLLNGDLRQAANSLSDLRSEEEAA